jgi:hypothetical protein
MTTSPVSRLRRPGYSPKRTGNCCATTVQDWSSSDLGLLAEEYDTTTNRQVGNVPQAFSHVALVNTARHLSGAGLRTDRDE